MADRYVNYDKLLEKRHHLGLDEISMISKVNAFNRFIDRLPTADVVEVKHGHFKETTEPLGARDVSCVECSVCGDSWIIEEDYSIEDYEMYWHYCPNCGAKMDKRSEDGV